MASSDYAAFDPGLFAKEFVPIPTEHDIEIFGNLVQAIRLAPPQTSSAKLQTLLSVVLRSNKNERDLLFRILGTCGILATPDHPGFPERFIHDDQLAIMDGRFGDLPYPACWWQADVDIRHLVTALQPSAIHGPD